MKIISLSKNNLNDAINLVVRLFDSKPSDFDYPGKWMNASLNPKSKKSMEAYNKEILPKVKCTYVKYWVGIDKKTKKVIGTTGIYTQSDDEKDSVWVAWFCVDPIYRGRGYGSQLLDFAINKAKKMNKKFLKLYTSYNTDIKNAMLLYEKRGFQIFKKEIHPDSKEEMIYILNIRTITLIGQQP